MTRSRIVCILTGLLVFVWLAEGAPAQIGRRPRVPAPTPPRPAAETRPAFMNIRVDDELMTAEIVSTPLPGVLEEIAARTGVVFEIGTHDVTPVSVSFYRVTLQEAIERLVQNNNSIFYYSPNGSGPPRIEFVRVFSRSDQQPKQPSLRYIGTGAVTKTGDDTVDTPEQALKVLAESQNVDARQEAIEVLAATRDETAAIAVTAALNDAAPEVRAAAVEALAGMGMRSALPQVLLALKDSHPGVRQSAIAAVALLGDAGNIRDLKPLTRDKDASVAAAAEIGVKKLALHRP